jgi:hypothetical protein
MLVVPFTAIAFIVEKLSNAAARGTEFERCAMLIAHRRHWLPIIERRLRYVAVFFWSPLSHWTRYSPE